MNYRLETQEYIDGIVSGDRVILAKSITLAESQLEHDKVQFDKILKAILEKTGNSIRLGITGVPGVGKSTLIESFGKYLINTKKKKVAILTVDPSSVITKGSILGDKTRMPELSKMEDAFIRSTSTGKVLGGITDRTREAILLCEAAGFDIVIVETVGVGQSETSVKKIVDFFILLLLAGAGDELQGIKKGIMEMADLVVITKADGDNKRHASNAQAEFQQAVNLFQPNESGWLTRIQTCSSLTGEGIYTIWQTLEEFIHFHRSTDHIEITRRQQLVTWMEDCFDLMLKSAITDSKTIAEKRELLQNQVMNMSITPQLAAQQLFLECIALLKKDTD